MAQIVQNPPNLGEMLGTGLSQGIQQLAQNKLQELSRRQEQQQVFKALQAGQFPQDLASFLSQLPSAERQLALKNLYQSGGIPTGQPTGMSALGGLQEPQVPGSTEAQAPVQQQVQKPLTPYELLSRPPVAVQQKQELLDLKKESAREKIATKKQAAIDLANKPFLDSLNKAVPIAEEMHDKAEEMLKLLDSGKITSGFGGVAGRLTGGLSLNPESQRFLALSNDIAALLAANSGVATNFKIKFAQERKPNLQQKPETQKALTEDILKQAKKVLDREKIANGLISQNNYNQLPNLKSKVDEEYRKIKPQKAESKSNKKIFNELPNPAELKGKKIRDKDSGEILESDGIEWRKVS